MQKPAGTSGQKEKKKKRPASVTHASALFEVFAGPVEVRVQLVHSGVLVADVVEDVVQVEVQDVGVQAADAHVVLEGSPGGSGSARARPTRPTGSLPSCDAPLTLSSPMATLSLMLDSSSVSDR